MEISEAREKKARLEEIIKGMVLAFEDETGLFVKAMSFDRFENSAQDLKNDVLTGVELLIIL